MVSLANVQVDVTTRLGAPAKLTPTGFRGLDALLCGGLRAGAVLGITGAAGSGRTSLSLMIAYMAARTQAAVCFAGRGVDDTEVMARLAARAVRRSYPSSEVTYGDIWSGGAHQSDAVRRAVADAVETVVSKVGTHLHIASLARSESPAELAERMTQLWARHERVLLVVDDLEGLAGSHEPLESRLLNVAYELKEVAEHGCAVVFTALGRHAELVAPAATAMVQIERKSAVADAGPQAVTLALTKNRMGPIGTLSLEILFGASEITEL